MSLDRLKTALEDRYLLDRELGQGGMATVYLARDLRHKRDVAIKVLRPDLAAALGPERFLREIETTANLRHPGILPLYDSGEAGGFLFYVMPFVEGESLRDRMTREKQLPVDAALQIAREAAEALGYAHARGVIHRDIKPENILLENGHAVVADFGIARAMSVLDGSHMTQTGLAVGTPAYMSPEQVLADSALDGRSDLYSLGCVLFEMLTGEPPFASSTTQRTIARRLTEPPPAPSANRPEVGAHLSGVVQLILATDPADRPATAAAFLELLSAPPRTSRTSDSGAVRQDEGFWVAVLPFKYSGANPDLTALAEGLSEEIVTGLSRFSYLRVIARGSTLRYVNEAVDVRTVGKEIGARYVMEGSLRQAGSQLRVAVQLVDAATGAHLWAENYNRPFDHDEIFALQDDLVPRIVSTVADWYGVLPHTMSEALRSKGPEELSPYEAVLRSFGYYERITVEEHAAVRAGLERAVQQAPGNADGWAMLSMIYGEEHRFGFNAQPDPLGRALQAARRAADAAPSNHFAYLALAQALYFRKEFQAFRSAAERAIALNPMDGSTLAYMGHLMAFSGDWEHGCHLTERAMQLNPHHPEWYWFVSCLDAYRKSDYRSALASALNHNMPGVSLYYVAIAASSGQLGEPQGGRSAVRELLALEPDYTSIGRDELGKWYRPELVELLIDGLRKAGLEIAPAVGLPGVVALPSPGQSVAVLPFANMSADPQDEFFADGITEEIINALAQLKGLRVAARTSCFAFKGKTEDLRVVGDKLGVGTVLEGSVRKAGSRLRITAQLINVTDGCHLWSERYDRELSDVFAMQDEIAGAIAAKLQLGLAGEPANPPPRSAPGNLEAYELLLKGRVLLGRRGRAIVEARACLERAVVIDPTLAEGHALLGDCYRLHAMYGITSSTDMMPLARAAAVRALELDPEQVEALATLANVTANYDWDLPASSLLTDRALARDPSHTRALAERALIVAVREVVPEEMERALLDLRTARGIDPLNSWLAAMHAFGLLFAGRPAEALVEAQRAVDLDAENFTARWVTVLVLAALARHDEALAAAEPALLMSGRNPRILAEVAAVHAARGDSAAAEAVYQEVRGRARTGYIGWAEQGAIAASAGRLEEARALVRQAIEAREVFLVFWKLPSWRPLKGDPEGLRILRSTGL